MVLKKISICICLVLCYLNLGLLSEVSAAAPNAKECIEENLDCDKLEKEGSNGTRIEASENENGSLVFDLIKMVFALLLVLALIYVLLKLLNKRNKIFQQVKALENIGGISVGQNKSIQIIRIGSRVYVVGVGDNVELLHEITNENEKEELLHINQANEFQAGSFVTALFQQKKNDNSTNQTKSEFKNLFTTELDKLKSGRRKMINHHKQKGDKHE
ncbi:flagellar biosynthetic protein FliO [Virgibacillus necropolis]|uniref:Flagellar protein n=1 Tax=Virgibacillus necropolis TaxID=163877 RepID=A0A221MDH3_9BACI|nr:flagellar biosynthetic protein FliO [Virgibacillus necropolis]ASN05716.1 flagellar protein [Virgibacillus necropolis]